MVTTKPPMQSKHTGEVAICSSSLKKERYGSEILLGGHIGQASHFQVCQQIPVLGHWRTIPPQPLPLGFDHRLMGSSPRSMRSQASRTKRRVRYSPSRFISLFLSTRKGSDR